MEMDYKGVKFDIYCTLKTKIKVNLRNLWNIFIEQKEKNCILV